MRQQRPLIHPSECLIVTRHDALVRWLRAQWPELAEVQAIAHATEDQVRGKIVFGVLPLHLAALALCIVEVPLETPPELRSKDLSLEEMSRYARTPRAYQVRQVGWTYPRLRLPDRLRHWLDAQAGVGKLERTYWR